MDPVHSTPFSTFSRRVVLDDGANPPVSQSPSAHGWSSTNDFSTASVQRRFGLEVPPTRPLEKVPVVRMETARDVEAFAAQRMAELIRKNNARSQPTVLGLATGSTPLGVYRELVRMHREEGLDFSRVVTFNLDEYWPIQPNDPQSYNHYMWEHLFRHVNIDPANVHLPPGNIAREDVPAACADYERRIESAGGLELQLLGIGETGHVGFNEPGATETTRTRQVQLHPLTRERAVEQFGSLELVPHEAITTGVGTILGARELLLLATGPRKADIVKRSVEGEISPEVPATFLQRHANVRFVVDSESASKLTSSRER